MRIFHQLLINTAVASITNFTVWFALTFYLYLETRSVFATGTLSGIYLTLTMMSGFWFGSLVDHHSKKGVMLFSSVVSLTTYAASITVFYLAPEGSFKTVGSVWLWTFVALQVVGIIFGNIRSIALATLVTLLVPEERRAKANGLVGMVNGVAFGLVSVISGILVGRSGMHTVLILALLLTMVAIVHLLAIRVPPEVSAAKSSSERASIDLRGTMVVLSAIPGIYALIFFTTFNNFLGGVFMALIDAYGLSLVAVETWGLLLGLLSFAFMVGGAAIARWGLGKNPLRTMMLVNIITWSIAALFTIQSSIVLFMAGMAAFFALSPYVEAAEQTVLQKVVPVERQGRVFGFAQSVEQAASPFMAFLIGPITEFAFIPFMTTGLGAQRIGHWFGTGSARGIALVFTVAGICGLLITILAMKSSHYRRLSDRYLEAESASAENLSTV